MNHKLYLCKDGIEIEATVQIPLLGNRNIMEKISYQQEAVYKDLELVKITPIIENNVLKKILLEVKKPDVDNVISNINKEINLIEDYSYLGKVQSISKREYDVFENKFYYRLVKIGDKSNYYTFSKSRYEDYLNVLKEDYQHWGSSKNLGKKYNWTGTLLAVFFNELEIREIPIIDKGGHKNRTYEYKIKKNTYPLSRKPPDEHIVHGYTKADGTSVSPHKRGEGKNNASV